MSGVNCLSTNYVLSLTILITSNFSFSGFCFHNFNPPLKRSWLRHWPLSFIVSGFYCHLVYYFGYPTSLYIAFMTLLSHVVVFQTKQHPVNVPGSCFSAFRFNCRKHIYQMKLPNYHHQKFLTLDWSFIFCLMRLSVSCLFCTFVSCYNITMYCYVYNNISVVCYNITEYYYNITK